MATSCVPETVKSRLQKLVQNLLNYSEEPRSALYLYGRPGVGKKTIARALCHEAGLKLAVADLRGLLQTPENFADNFRFLVEMDGIVQAGFAECSGFGSNVEVVEYREGGDSATVRKLPGKISYPDISLKWGVTDSTELYDWHIKAVNGEIERKNGSNA